MSRTGRVGVGLIGAGMISDAYLENLTRFPDVEVVTIGDLDTDRAASQAATFSVARSGAADDVLADDDVEIVINLTIPAVHVEVSSAALRAGKHVWSEKPVGTDRASAAGLVALADDLGLRLGIAPDTLLGPAWQTARRAVQDGLIGAPLSAVTAMQFQGPDAFHPNADFLFAEGAGPLFDMGPYYFTALVHLLGPVASVVATGTKSSETRRIVVGPRAGEEFAVQVPTHLSVLSTFEQGGTAQSLLSNDTALFRQGMFEIHGTEGSLVLPDPNHFAGPHPVVLARPLTEVTLPIVQELEVVDDEIEAGVGRGIGALDMARAIRHGGAHIADGHIGYHVLDTMVSVLESVERRAFVDVASTVGPVPTLPPGFDPFARTV